MLSAGWWSKSHICSIFALPPQAKCPFFFLFLHECQVLKVLKCANKDPETSAGSLQTLQGSLFKMMKAETKQEVVKVDNFSIFWLCRAFNFCLSIQMTGPGSDQRLQLTHWCVFFMFKLTPHFQHLSLWSLTCSVFHLHRKLSCAVSFNPEENRSASGQEEIKV